MANGVEQQTAPMNLADFLPLAAGVALFAWWLLSTSLGRTALAGSKPRRNRVPVFAMLAPFLIWLVGPPLLRPLAGALVDQSEGPGSLIADHLAYSLGSVVAVVFILILVHLGFVRGVKGWGLRLRTVPHDLALAFANLLAVWPLMMGMIVLVMHLGKALSGEDFQIPQHGQLELITTSTSVPLQVMIVVMAVVVAPVIEEMLFRGLFQTMIRSHLDRPWLALATTAAMFAVIHLENPEHWPALFVLALGLGYAYEKSGSLLRPIFMHAMFNGLTIAIALAETHGG